MSDPTTDFKHDQPIRTGILITNLGTPDAPTPAAVRRYLAEFLADPRVVEFPRIPWWFALHGIILRIRPRKAAQAYTKVWQADGSPLLSIARKQQKALTEKLAPRGIPVELGMRYGNPSIGSALDKLIAAGVRRLLVLPLYPQYSSSTTASTFDAVSDHLRTLRWMPELRFVTQYHDDPPYISALAASVKKHFQANGQPKKLIFSFHGIPQRYFLAGDPYHCHCHKTARLVAEALGLADDDWMLTFQSRFGREKWLEPYTDHTLEALGKQGVDHVAVVCPGFSADCLETLEEIDMMNREVFMKNGGKQFHYIPALNDNDEHIEALVQLCLRQASGWPETEPDWDTAKPEQDARESQQRARSMGAKN